MKKQQQGGWRARKAAQQRRFDDQIADLSERLGKLKERRKNLLRDLESAEGKKQVERIRVLINECDRNITKNEELLRFAKEMRE